MQREKWKEMNRKRETKVQSPRFVFICNQGSQRMIYSQSESGLDSKKRTGFKSQLCLGMQLWSSYFTSLWLSFFFCKVGTGTPISELWRWNKILHLNISQALGRCSKHCSLYDSLQPGSWLWVLAFKLIFRSFLTFGFCGFLFQELKRWL